MVVVDISRLTTCKVNPDGSSVRLSGVNAGGEDFHLHVSVEQLGTLSMTLPHLLSEAIKARYRDPTLRYVFPLGGSAVEEATGGDAAILSLKTPDGFEVSFAVQPAALAKLADQCSSANASSGMRQVFN